MRRLLLVAALVSGGSLPGLRAQSALESFDPTANDNVSAMLRQSDGKIIVAGSFWKITPNRTDDSWDRGHVARLHPDGALDTSFWAGFNGDIACAVLQPDGKIVVGGGFTSVHTLGAPDPVPRNGLARLNSDGTLDTAFDPNPIGSTFPLPLVRTLALQADGSLVVGGGFNSFQPAGTASPVARNRIARLNADGSLDASFDPSANNVVLALLVQADGKILVGGGFTTLQPNGAAAVARQRMARLNADGSVDSTFGIQFDNRVLSLTAQANGAILIGGDFVRVTFAGDSEATVAPRLIRLNADGVRDNTFDPVPNGSVFSTAVQADGRILVGGSFTTVASRTTGLNSARTYLVRLMPNGSIDSTFSTFPSSYVTSFLLEPDGSVVIGGYFTRVQGTGGATSVERGRIARLQPNGALDSAFNVANLGTSEVVVRLADGSTIYGGSFQSFGGLTRPRLARVAANGVLDPAFAPEFNGTVNDVVVLPDGKLLVSGAFTRIGTAQRQYLARLNADGSVDTAFNPKPNGQVLKIVLQADGKILISGNFTTLSPNDATTATTRNFIARLNADGTVDTPFDPSTNGVVAAFHVESSGSILIGGFFTALRPNAEGDAISRSYLARLTSAGKVDTAFNISLDNTVQAIAVQADGKILIGGSFNNIAPSGAATVSERAFIARLNADLSLDTTFNPKANAAVTDIVPLPDTRIAIAGNFTTLQPNGATVALERRFFAWLESDGSSPDARAYSFDGPPTALTLQADGLFVSGNFSRVFIPGGRGVPVEAQVVKFSLAGVLDISFVAGTVGAAGNVGAIAIQSDGRILLGGSFEGILGTSNQNLTRVTTDGFPDTTFFSKPNGAVHAVAFLRQAEDAVALGGPGALLNASGQFLDGFDPTDISTLSGSVTAIARQSDGKLLVGGSLSSGFAVPGANIFRFNADGSVDESFKPVPDLAVHAIAVQSDGKILVGGDFVKIGETTRNRIARLNTDGTLDTAYDPSANSSVYAIEILSDGKVLVGGAFTTLQPNGATSATSRAYFARLNADGTLDSLNASLNGIVRKITLQTDGKILLGGGFTQIGTTTRTYLARLNTDGGLDTAFQPNANEAVFGIAQQSDGKIVVGGAFTGFFPGGATDLTSMLYLARLNADGTLDAAFKPAPSNTVNSVAVQSDGKIIVGGAFNAFQPDANRDPTFRSGLARLNTDGTVDPGFNPIPNGAILTVRIFSGNTLAIGGTYTALFPLPSMLVGGAFTAFSETPVNHLARLYGNGLIDVNFGLQANATVNALATQPDDAIVVAGAFTEISGVARGGLARVTVAGGLDEAFNPNANAAVRTALVLPGGKVLVGGEFTTVGGAAAQRLALINADGSLDAGFTATVDGPVNAVVAQGDGKYVVAGAFATVGGAARSNLARVNADGTVDASFNPALNGEVSALALQGDGKIVVGGAFTQIGGVARRGVARLNANGTLDTTFDASTNGDVTGLALQYNGGLIVGGNFSQIGAARRTLVARLSATSLAAQVITVDAGLTAATLSLGGGSGDFSTVAFSQSTDASTWTSLGAAQRTGQPGQWRVSGLTLPASTAYFLRAEGMVSTSRYGSSSSRQVIAQFFGATPAASFALPAGWGSSGGSSGDGGSGSSGGGNGGDGGSGGGSGGGSDSGSGGSGGDGSSGSGSGSGEVFGVVNLSGRGEPLADAPLITGFVVSGNGPQEILLRAIGPGLTAFGVNDAVELPQLRIYDQTGALLQAVGSWNGDASLAAAFSNVGAFELDPASSDAAIALTLNPGAYSVHVLDSESVGGIALGEIYVVPDASVAGALANVSLRGPVGAGDAILVAGFAVEREEPQSLLIRGAGPSLARFGVVDAVQDPAIRIFNAEGGLMAENDDWSVQTGLSAAEMAAEMAAVGAFSFAPGSGDSAVVVTLPRGSYTIQLSGGAPGTALIEIYSAP